VCGVVGLEAAVGEGLACGLVSECVLGEVCWREIGRDGEG